jgi:NADPH-dependent 2,4-dienoyl-CoA reductase/sulfur reductase-like enzyme
VIRAADGCCIKLVDIASRRPVPWALFEIAPAVKSLLRGDMTEQGCQLMATLGIVVNSLGNLEAVLPAASALAKRHLELKDGRVLAADTVVVAVGIKPNAEVATQAGIAVNRGIVVDDHLVTSTSDVFAIGECAEHRGVCYGLVEPANEQARTLAERLAGRDARKHPHAGHTYAERGVRRRCAGYDATTPSEMAVSGHERDGEAPPTGATIPPVKICS